MLVSGPEDRDPHTVEKIMGISDILIVSGESISMVSEAVSSGKPVIVFMPEKVSKKTTKYEKFVKKLEEEGYIRTANPENIPETVSLIASDKRKPAVPDDGARIREKLYRLF